MNIPTIVAQATATGEAGIGIIRISGGLSMNIAQTILGTTPKPRYAHYGDFCDESGELIDKGVAIFYPNPHSFTGEDVLELQAHGGTAVMQSLMQTCLLLGAKPAQAGEFSQRAFLNNKMDLAQAEAVADLISASTKQGAQSALRSLTGEFSAQINTLVQQMTSLRVLIEATIDFSDEDIDTSEIDYMAKTLNTLSKQVGDILANAKQGRLLRDGIHIVIAGKPNAGKSSLLNALTKNDSAIVTDIAGTTRDVLTETIDLNGVPVHILDTAGLHHSDNIVEKEGIRRALVAINNADCVLLVYETGSQPDITILPEMGDKPLLLVKNKIDINQQHPQVSITNLGVEVAISAKHQLGLESLKDELLSLVGLANLGENTVLARTRHIQALLESSEFLQSATKQLSANSRDLLAEDLRLASNSLGKITGYFSSDELLGEIFNNFCVGK